MSSVSRSVASSEDFLVGGGAMGDRIRSFDWSQTSVGRVDTWPQSLRTAVSIVLETHFPMYIAWGPHFIQIYNDGYIPILGPTKHPAALGLPSRETFPEIWDVIGPMFAGVMQGRAVGVTDFLLLLHRHGFLEECYFTFSYSPIRDESGSVGGILTTTTETTERVLGARRLQTLRDLAARTGTVSQEESAWREAAQALGANAHDLPFALLYRLDERTGQTELMAASGPDRDDPAPDVTSIPEWPFQEVGASRRPQEVSDLQSRWGSVPSGPWPEPPQSALVLPIARAGAELPFGFLVAGVSARRSLDDGYRGFLGLVADQIATAIGNARAYEAERKRAEALAELDRAKTTFFSNVSHEFRTPLTLMLAPIEDLRTAPAGAGVAPEAIDLLYRNAIRLLKLVNTLLEFSRIEAGRVEAVYEPVDLAVLTAELASSFRAATERAGLSLVVDCPPLPEHVYVDRDMWEKIVLNLLSNAVKFTFAGSITVRLRQDEKEAQLEVIDTGTGIAPGEVPRLFERFHRIEGARSRSHEGSGIGLALVQELVHLHGGSVTVTTRLDEGTSFRVRIPRGAAHLPAGRVRASRSLPSTALGSGAYVSEALRWTTEDGANGPSPPAAPERDERGSQPRERIVFADDNADMRDYVSRLLRERWDVETVSDGKAALARAKADPPALVLCDVMMPHLDGFELVQAIRADPALRTIPVILLSARAGHEDAAAGLSAGANDYIAKPFLARDLLVRLASALATARVSREVRAIEAAQRAALYRHFMQAPFPIAVFRGPHHVVDLANPSTLAAWGKDAGIVGEPLVEAVPELRDQPFLGYLDGVFRTGVAYEGREELARLPTGPEGAIEEIYCNFVYAPLRDGAGVIEGVLLSAFVVTDQVRARKELEDALQRAEENRRRSAALAAELKEAMAERSQAVEAAEMANRSKDAFLANLSHELRTPLNAIVGWSNMLRTGAVDGAQVPKALETIERNARIQSRLIEDMLDLARIEQGKLVLSVGPTEMVRVVEAAIDAVRPAAEGRGVRLQPILDSHATIVGDPDRLQQVVWNLLSNAIKFTPRGGRVQVSLQRAPSNVELVVADSGQGIARDFLPFVFDRFRQADGKITRKASGLGLGLAIVRAIVELHGGTVAAQSEGVGLGATFTVRLPTAPLRAASATPGTPAHPSTQLTFECPPALAGLRVLVVDDEADTRELLRYVLAQCDAQVTSAASAAEALTYLSATELPDVLVSDIGMPETDGYTFIRQVRALPGQAGRVPAIALTAYASSEDRTLALRAGFDMHLTKPVQPNELLVVIATLVDGVRRRFVGPA